jgi:hypothetical protein
MVFVKRFAKVRSFCYTHNRLHFYSSPSCRLIPETADEYKKKTGPGRAFCSRGKGRVELSEVFVVCCEDLEGCVRFLAPSYM